MSKVVYIDAPERLSRRQRRLGTLLTGLMWAAYAYLWLPLISLLAWGLGLEFAYDVMMRAGGASALRSALFWYGVVLVDVVLTVTVWSLFNKWRFAHHNRRTAHVTVADAALTEYFGVTPGALERLRTARRIEIEIDVQGRPVVPIPAPTGDAPPPTAARSAL